RPHSTQPLRGHGGAGAARARRRGRLRVSSPGHHRLVRACVGTARHRRGGLSRVAGRLAGSTPARRGRRARAPPDPRPPPPRGTAGVVFLALLAVWLGRPLLGAIADPAPRRIIAVIKAAVLGIILVDAAFTTAASSLLPGTLVALCFVPAYVLGRRFASA